MLHLDDLKRSYRITLGKLQASREKIEENIAEAPELAAVYEEDLSHISEMISDVNYNIEWLHTGRQPRSKRGVDRRSVYQRTVLMDPTIMERYMKPINSRSATTLTDDERHKLEEVLDILSPREREVFTMAKGEGFPHEYIADMLNIHKGSVDVMVKRAHDKVSAGWQGTLF
ncbi:hypothetical protein A7975_32550 [Bacillus sp. FJAT-26390]|nr:hypothetical protein A7975_32550 [Bacillus sp. FJAT-26390]